MLSEIFIWWTWTKYSFYEFGRIYLCFLGFAPQSRSSRFPHLRWSVNSVIFILFKYMSGRPDARRVAMGVRVQILTHSRNNELRLMKISCSENQNIRSCHAPNLPTTISVLFCQEKTSEDFSEKNSGWYGILTSDWRYRLLAVASQQWRSRRWASSIKRFS